MENILSKPDTEVTEEIENISIDDSTLIRQCRLGDLKAMERLIVRYQDRIYNVIMKIVGNSDDAAELTQETFVKVIEKIDTFKSQSSFYTWLFRIGLNLTLTFCKRRAKVPMLSLDAAVGAEDGEGATQLKAFLADKESLDPAMIAQSREIGEIVMQSLGALESDHRAVLVLRDIEGMSYAEIAEALEVQLGTVKSRLSRARANLKEILDTVL